MAKLLRLPSQAIIDGFKGTVDYYVHDGVACARSWPRSPGHQRAATVMATWPAFTAAARGWNLLSPAVQEAYKRMSAGTRMSGRDIFMKMYLNGSSVIELT